MAQFFTILLEGANASTDYIADYGDDYEFAVIVGGRNWNGDQIKGVHPGPPGYPGGGLGADDNDGDVYWWNIKRLPSPRLLNHFIWREQLPPGQSAIVGLAFMEFGRDPTLDALIDASGKIAGIVASTDVPIVSQIADVLSIVAGLIPDNPTSPLGSVVISATNAGFDPYPWNYLLGENTSGEEIAPAQVTDPRYQGTYRGLHLNVSKPAPSGNHAGEPRPIDLYLRLIVQEE